MLFNLENNRKLLYQFLDYFYDFFDHLKLNNVWIGFIISFLHYSIITFIIIYFIIGPINSLYYFLIFFSSLLILINIIFNCCPLIKLERKLFDNKQWYGIYEYEFKLLHIPLTRKNIKISYYLKILVLLIVLFFRLYWNR
uniref:DUF2784 family protein n=1 Tax=viral metagenome TaxID=1070528 RepID=A0A6C0KIV9_9ZZZZ